jgi:hypothetical protein
MLLSVNICSIWLEHLAIGNNALQLIDPALVRAQTLAISPAWLVSFNEVFERECLIAGPESCCPEFCRLLLSGIWLAVRNCL